MKCDSETTTQDDINRGVVTSWSGSLRSSRPNLSSSRSSSSLVKSKPNELTGVSIMAQFSVNPQRFDPYKNFKFRVKWDGRYVAGVSKVGSLKRTTEVVKHREGGDPSSSRKSPGRSEFEAITLERGVTHESDLKNGNKSELRSAGRGVFAKDFRKDSYRCLMMPASSDRYKSFRSCVSESSPLRSRRQCNAVASAHQARKRRL